MNYKHSEDLYFQFVDNKSKIYLTLLDDDDVFYSLSGLSGVAFLLMETGEFSLENITEFLVNKFESINLEDAQKSLLELIESLEEKKLVVKVKDQSNIVPTDFDFQLDLSKKDFSLVSEEELPESSDSPYEISAISTSACPTLPCPTYLCTTACTVSCPTSACP